MPLKIFGASFLPITTPILKNDPKTIAPSHFHLSVQEPVIDDGFRFIFKSPASLLPSPVSGSQSTLLARLAVPILRYVTKNVSFVDAMTMWNPDVWLSQSHPFEVQPENIMVMPKEFAEILK